MAMTNHSSHHNSTSDNALFDSLMQSLAMDLPIDNHIASNSFNHDSYNILQSSPESDGLSDHDQHHNLNNSDGNDQQNLTDHTDPFHTDSNHADHSNTASDNLHDDHNHLNINADQAFGHDTWQNIDHNHLDVSNLSDHSPNLTEHSHEDLSASVPGKTNASLHETQQLQSLNYTDSGAITTSDNKSVELYANNIIYWHSGARIGRVDGQNFYDSYGNYIGRLGVDLNVYNAGGCKIGCVTPSGNAYTPGGKLFATGGTARWAAATLIFNTCL